MSEFCFRNFLKKRVQILRLLSIENLFVATTAQDIFDDCATHVWHSYNQGDLISCFIFIYRKTLTSQIYLD